MRCLRDQWAGFLALFLVIAGGTAYAANTIASNDIIDGEVKTPDIANGAVNSSKIANGQVKAADIGQGAVTIDELAQAAVANPELRNDAVTTQKVLNGTLLGADVADNTLKGADIDESTLQGIGGGGPAGGVRRIRFDVTIPSDGSAVTRTVLDLAPLRLIATCDRDASEFRLEAATSAQNAGFDMGFTLNAGGQNFVDTRGGGLGATPQSLLNVRLTDGGFVRAVGNLVYNDPATTIAIPFTIFGAGNDANSRCFFTGVATRASG